MQERGFIRVAELMGRMAAPDGTGTGDAIAAAFEVQREFAPALRAAVRRAAALRSVELPRAEVDELLADVVLVLHDHAAAWRPDGGALPWVWAERRIANVVDRHLGLFADELDDARVARAERQAAAQPSAVAAAAEPSSTAVLARLASADPRAAVLREALAVVASPRDVELWLEMRVEEQLGDRAPAATVAPHLGLSPEAARQQRRRIDQRLRRLAATDERFARLAEVSGFGDLASVA